jgi:pSer/pThr/pTyr-binding forkhead associated (FHA) protein
MTDNKPMAKLIIKFNDVVIDQVLIRAGDMNIGRRPGSDVLLDNLAVSGSHATLFTIGEDTFVQDLNSTNGTFVNNKRISKHHLQDGDTITIGNHTLTYVNENAAKANPNLAKTVIINPQKQEAMLADAGKATPAPPPSPAPAKPAAAAEPARVASLFILSGANPGKRIDITMPVTNLGRAGRRAGVISRAGQRYMLLPGDEGQTPRLNGVKVGTAGEELKHGDIIEIADSRMRFHLQ